MRPSRLWAVAVTVATTATLVVSGVVLATSAQAVTSPSAAALAIARQTLAAGDGWASAARARPAARPPTTPTSASCTTAPSWSPRSAATTRPTTNATPKIIFVSGGIDGNVDDADNPLTCADYADPALHPGRLPRRLRPGGVGPDAPSRPGPLEDARVALGQEPGRRASSIKVGVEHHHRRPRRARRSAASTSSLDKVDNVIVRNLRLRGRRRLLPRLGPDRRRDRQLELALRHCLADRRHARVGRPQHLQRRQQHRRRPAALLRPAVPGARRRARHHQRRPTWSRPRGTTSSTTTRRC